MWLSLIFACPKAPADPPPLVAAAPTVAHMAEVSEAADRARIAILAGDRRSAGRELSWLAAHGPDPIGVPATMAPMAALVRTQAQAGSEATELVEMALAVGSMGFACGACHAAAGAQPVFPYAVLPPGAEIAPHMARHGWGMDSLWAGLVTPDETAWGSGARVFLEEPLTEEDPMLAGLQPWADAVHALGGYSLEVAEPSTRGVLFGEILGLCATCHEALGSGPETDRR